MSRIQKFQEYKKFYFTINDQTQNIICIEKQTELLIIPLFRLNVESRKTIVICTSPKILIKIITIYTHNTLRGSVCDAT